MNRNRQQSSRQRRKFFSRRVHFELRGSTALITGASSGLGRHVAMRLAQAGANVVLAARRADKLEEAAAEARAFGVKALAVSTDVGQPAQLEELVERTIAEFGSIDVLVNNAGVEAFAHFERLPLERIAHTVEVNLTSALLLTRLVLPHMLLARRGHIVNMSSTAGKHGAPFGGTYAATKAGLIAFTQALRAEYQGRGVSASVICPGFADAGGIYDRMKEQSGRSSPALVGSTTAERVAEAVCRAIERDRAEVIVNWPPMRPLMVVAQIFPSLGIRIVRALTIRFLKRVVDSTPE